MVRIPYARPRPPIVAVLGEEHQDSPCLVLADPQQATGLDLPIKEANGHHFIDDEKSIMLYLSTIYKVSRSPR